MPEDDEPRASSSYRSPHRVDRVLPDGTFFVTGGNQDGSRVTRYGPCRLECADPAHLTGPGCDTRPIYGIAAPPAQGRLSHAHWAAHHLRGLAVILAMAGPSPRPWRLSQGDRAPAPATRTAAAARTPRPPAPGHAELNRQDRVTRAHQARESRALEDRPLLSELPLELGPVALDAAGLAADGRRTIVTVPGPDRPMAEAAYRQALAALGDPGSAYELRWEP